MHTLSSSIGGLKAAKLLHLSLLNNVIHLPVTTFFDVTPVGRILARFSSDVNVLDGFLPHLLQMWLPSLLRVSNFILVHFRVIVKYWLLTESFYDAIALCDGGVLWLGNGFARCFPLYESKNLCKMMRCFKCGPILHFYYPVLKHILVAYSLWCICSVSSCISNL